MRLPRIVPFSCIILVALAASPLRSQQSPNPAVAGPGVGPQVRLTAKDGQTHFQLGDLITLELVFSNPGYVPIPVSQKLTPIQRARQALHPLPGQHTINRTDYGDLADRITITPADGWFQWQGKSGHDYSDEGLLTDHEVRVPLALNQGYIFRKPGHYELSVTTYRLDGKPVTTNVISLDLTARPAHEERALVRRLNKAIAKNETTSSTCRCTDGNEAAEQLAALPGNDAVRAKVRWLLADDTDGVQDTMADGMAASRNYDLQLQLLQAALRDPRRTPDFAVLKAVESTRIFQSGKMLDGWRMTQGRAPTDATSQSLAEERRADIQAIVDSLPKRSGRNLTDTAYFLMEFAGADRDQEATVRPVAIEEFGKMVPMEQGMLLGGGWQKIRDPKLIPALRAMLDKPPAQFVGYGEPLERLLELDPTSAKPYVVREICNTKSDVQMKQMAALPDSTLPETDACLLQQVIASASINKPNGVTPWPEKALIAARFASEGIYPQLLVLFRAHPEWNDTVRGAMIAYFVRWHPEIAAELLPVSSLLEQPNLLFYTFNEVLGARHGGYPESLLLPLREKLAHGSANEAGPALYYLSEFGTQEDAANAIARLDRLIADWNGREAELVSPTPSPQAREALQLRKELVFGLCSKDGASVLPDAERLHIKQLCLGATGAY